MKLSKQRIFIKNLPETATQDEIEKIFSHYGKISSIEIKERKKDVNLKNLSLFFSYVNIEIDDHNLQKCFQDFANEEWHGQYVELQIAKESFLEKLKREREESGQTNGTLKKEAELVAPISVQSGVKKKASSVKSSSEESSSSESEDEKKPVQQQVVPKITKAKESSSSSSEEDEDSEKEEEKEKLDLVIKNNKYKKIDKNGLKIESVGKEPILIIEQKKKSKAANIDSLKQMQKEYQGRQAAIKAALNSIDKQPKNKIIFGDEPSSKKVEETRKPTKSSNSNHLFNNAEESDEEIYNFEVKNQFEGAKGQKLMELQSKFKSDKRFKMDERFLDDNYEKPEENGVEHAELTIEDEKKRELEILEEVLGKKLRPTASQSEQKKISMVRYDPSLPEHSQYELKTNEPVSSTSKRRRKDDNEQEEDQAQPVVSKEVFYNVSESLKDTFQEKEEFSLLKMFGRSEEIVQNDENNEFPKAITKKPKLDGNNPFKYDSTDEDEPEEAPKEKEQVKVQAKMWTEPFFFTEDDFRLQEGGDFILKMAAKKRTGEDFGKLRREIKQIVKGKVKNCQRKNKPFKKKLGGNKRKKNIRLKKAMKR